MSLQFSSTSCSHFFSLSLLATLSSFFPLISFYSQAPHNLYLPSYWPLSSLLANENNSYSQYTKRFFFCTNIYIVYKASINSKLVKEREVIKLEQKSYIRKCTHYNKCTILHKSTIEELLCREIYPSLIHTLS